MSKGWKCIHPFRSAYHAMMGIVQTFKTERNFRIQTLAAIIVIGLGIYYKIDRVEWFAVGVSIALMLGAELMNTAIEYVCDSLRPEYDSKIKVAKDAAAGACLVMALFALTVGLIVFLPLVLGGF